MSHVEGGFLINEKCSPARKALGVKIGVLFDCMLVL